MEDREELPPVFHHDVPPLPHVNPLLLPYISPEGEIEGAEATDVLVV